MSRLLSDAGAEVFLVVGASGGATLTEIATATGRPLSSVQRAVESLTKSQLLVRSNVRGRFAIGADAPSSAIREVAIWAIGDERAGDLERAMSYVRRGGKSLPPGIRSPSVRRFLPIAVERIVRRFDPEQVILFGSQARGDADEQSDVDLLVVLRHVEDPRSHRVAMRDELSDMPFGKDILVTSTDRFDRPIPGTVIKSAKAEGVRLYGR